jgi:hypothetical protein
MVNIKLHNLLAILEQMNVSRVMIAKAAPNDYTISLPSAHICIPLAKRSQPVGH